jgi:hypothetical protein
VNEAEKILFQQKARDVVGAIKEAALAANDPIEIPIRHHFSPGVYAREMVMPKGSLVVGKIHRFGQLNILSGGEVSLISQDGAVRVKAPYTFVGTPGAQRMIYAHEEATWTVIHGTELTDVNEIEEAFIAKSYGDLYLSSSRTLEDALMAIGASPLELTAISENEADQIPFPGPVAVEVKDSLVHGKGLFTTQNFYPGDVIAPARINGKRTPAGRFSNHSGEPNAEMKMRENGDVDLVALDVMGPGEEILTDYYFNYTNTREVEL